MPSLEEYIIGTYGNSRDVLTRFIPHITALRTVSAAYDQLLPELSGTGEGASVFAAMSHACFLAGVKLVTAGALPPGNMVIRGALENSLYGFYLFHHGELKQVWMNRHDSPAAKQRVRDEFPIGRMLRFLKEQNEAIGSQFDLVYNTTIDLGAHPNAMALTAHLVPIPDSTDYDWQYINLSPTDLAMGLRIAAMGGLNALNIFSLIFPEQMRNTGAGVLLVRAHDELEQLPDAGSEAERKAAEQRV